MLITAKQRSTEKEVSLYTGLLSACCNGSVKCYEEQQRVITSVNSVNSSEFVWRQQGRTERSKITVYNMTFWKGLALKQHTGNIETRQAHLQAGTCSKENLKSKHLSMGVQHLHREQIQNGLGWEAPL